MLDEEYMTRQISNINFGSIFFIYYYGVSSCDALSIVWTLRNISFIIDQNVSRTIIWCQNVNGNVGMIIRTFHHECWWERRLTGWLAFWLTTDHLRTTLPRLLDFVAPAGRCVGHGRAHPQVAHQGDVAGTHQTRLLGGHGIPIAEPLPSELTFPLGLVSGRCFKRVGSGLLWVDGVGLGRVGWGWVKGGYTHTYMEDGVGLGRVGWGRVKGGYTHTYMENGLEVVWWWVRKGG